MNDDDVAGADKVGRLLDRLERRGNLPACSIVAGRRVHMPGDRRPDRCQQSIQQHGAADKGKPLSLFGAGGWFWVGHNLVHGHGPGFRPCRGLERGAAPVDSPIHSSTVSGMM